MQQKFFSTQNFLYRRSYRLFPKCRLLMPDFLSSLANCSMLCSWDNSWIKLSRFDLVTSRCNYVGCVFTIFIYSIICILRTFLPHSPNLLPMPPLHYLSASYYCCERAFPVLAGQQSSWVLERWRQIKRGQPWREKKQQWGGVRVGGGWAVGEPKGLLLPRQYRGMFVSVYVRGPMCLSRQGRTILPHHRSTVEDPLPRPTVGPHSHLST